MGKPGGRKRQEIRRAVYTYAFFDYLTWNILAIVIPLYFISRGIPAGSIGLVLSFLPLVFIFVRLADSYLSDIYGVGFSFEWGAIMRTACAVIYNFSPSVAVVSVGKAVEGAGHALFWSVNRKTLYEASEDERETADSSAVMNAICEIANALGKIVAGAAIFFFGFGLALVLPLLSALALFVPASSLASLKKRRPAKPPSLKKAVSDIASFLNPARYRPEFRKIGGALTLGLAHDNVLFSLVLPVFLTKQAGLSALEVGAFLAVYSVIAGFGALLFFRKSRRSSAAIGLLETLSFGMLLLSRGRAPILLSLVILGFWGAFRKPYWETIISMGTMREPASRTNQGLLIAVIQAPGYLLTALALPLFGVLIDRTGFVPALACLALANIAFAFIGASVFSKEKL